MSLSVLHEQRMPLGWAVLAAVIALLAASDLLPAPSATTTGYQLSYAEEQVITGADGWGTFFIAVGVAAVVVGVAIAAPPAAAIIAGTAKAGAGLALAEGAGLIGGGLLSIAQGASMKANK